MPLSRSSWGASSILIGENVENVYVYAYQIVHVRSVHFYWKISVLKTEELIILKPDMVAYACNPSTGKIEEADQDHIDCIVSSIPAWPTRDLVSKIKQQKWF